MDPARAGPFTVAEHDFAAEDTARRRTFAATLWVPLGVRGPVPLVAYSHYSGGNRRAATFLTTHLASHGYAVAALDHSETFLPELRAAPGEDAAARAARVDALIASRVPDIRALLDASMREAERRGVTCDAANVGLAGHSFGGWTVLATPAADERIASVVALVPAGGQPAPPGTIAADVDFARRRPVPALFVAAEDDRTIPAPVVAELFARAPEPKRLVVLPAADHLHFIDDIQAQHEAFRALKLDGPLGDIVAQMKPAGELMPPAQAHRRVRALALAHFDATLRGSADAERYLAAATLRVAACDLADPRVAHLVQTHVARARSVTPPESAHALDAAGLQSPDVTAWTMWDGETLVAVGALRTLSAEHGEIKSMHTAEAARGRGAGTAMLAHIIDVARSRGMQRLSLETGASPYFAAARRLYERNGFVECAPYGTYRRDANSVFMTLALEP